jgi:hypothetical protein
MDCTRELQVAGTQLSAREVLPARILAGHQKHEAPAIRTLNAEVFNLIDCACIVVIGWEACIQYVGN